MASDDRDFSQSPPPEHLLSDFETLSKCSAKLFSGIIKAAFYLLIRRDQAENPLAKLSQIAEEHGQAPETVKALVKSVASVLTDAMKRNLTSHQLKDGLLKLGLDEENAQNVSSKWQELSPELTKVTLSQIVSKNRLVDFEWKFGVTASSSEIERVGNIFIQMKLIVSDVGDHTKNIYMELSLPQFYAFLHELERARAAMDRLG